MSNWTWIAGYEEKYKISDMGEVMSYWRRKKPFILKQKLDDSGYPAVQLYRVGGASKFLRVHSLVARSFVPGFSPGLHVNHLNGVKTDNRATNLEWVTNRENVLHGIRTGLINKRKPVLGIHLQTGAKVEFESMTKAAQELGVSMKSISECCAERQRSCAGYRWSKVLS